MKGRALPAIGRIEIAIIEESNSDFLTFEQGNLDLIALTGDVAPRALDGTQLKPAFARRGIVHHRFRSTEPDLHVLQHGGPRRRRLLEGTDRAAAGDRDGIQHGRDDPGAVQRQRVARDAAASAGRHRPRPVRQSEVDLRPGGRARPARPLRLQDRDGDGYRETPDGKPLNVVRGTLPESWYREADTLWRKNMDAIGIRMSVQQQTFSELLNLSMNGKLPMFNLGLRALEPSGYQVLQTLWGKSPNDTNRARFRNAEYDAAYEAWIVTPPGPERTRWRAGCRTSCRSTFR